MRDVPARSASSSWDSSARLRASAIKDPALTTCVSYRIHAAGRSVTHLLVEDLALGRQLPWAVVEALTRAGANPNEMDDLGIAILRPLLPFARPAPSSHRCRTAFARGLSAPDQNGAQEGVERFTGLRQLILDMRGALTRSRRKTAGRLRHVHPHTLLDR